MHLELCFAQNQCDCYKWISVDARAYWQTTTMATKTLFGLREKKKTILKKSDTSEYEIVAESEQP